MSAPARGVVLIDHGSREPGAGAALEELAALLRARLPDRVLVTAHLGAVAPSLEEAIALCAAAGARELAVLPCFLATGRHVNADLPRRLRDAGARHPELRLILAAPLGPHPAIAEALLDRLRESGG